MGAVLVTGASGAVGSSVVEHLLARGQRVVCAGRSPGPIPTGAEYREFDFADPSGWRDALTGVDRVFLMRPPPIADMNSTLIPFSDLALERGVRQLVFLSLQGVTFNRRTPHHAVEGHLRRVKAPYTFLRPNFFMQNLSTVYRDEIRDHDRIPVPAGSARTAFIDARDVGRVAAVALTESGHLGAAYTLSGEESLDYSDVARILSAELGRRIHYPKQTEREYLAELQRGGAAEDYIAVQKMIYRVVRLRVSASPNREVRRLTGEPATSFEQFAENHRQVWQRSRYDS